MEVDSWAAGLNLAKLHYKGNFRRSISVLRAYADRPSRIHCVCHLIQSYFHNVMQVNGVSVVNATHEHAVKQIKNAGDTLTLTVVEGRSFQTAGSQQAEQLNVDSALSSRISSGGSSFKPGVHFLIIVSCRQSFLSSMWINLNLFIQFDGGN